MNSMKRRQISAALLLGLILGCHKGYVALWENGAEEPKQIFPYRVTALPPADQEALEEGIHLKTVQELARLLEDYLS